MCSYILNSLQTRLLLAYMASLCKWEKISVLSWWSRMQMSYIFSPQSVSQSVSSVAQSCLTLCDPMNCSTPGLPVHHQLLEFTQTHVHPAISSSVVPFSSCPHSPPASECFSMSQLFARGGQSIGVSASPSVLPKNTQDWSPLEWTDWISSQSKGLSRVFSNTTVQSINSSALSFLHSPTLTLRDYLMGAFVQYTKCLLPSVPDYEISLLLSLLPAPSLLCMLTLP